VEVTFSGPLRSLSSRRNASSIGLLCKLQDFLCRDPLQSFCPALTCIKYPYSFHHVEDDDFLLQQLTRYNSLDLFINNFLGRILGQLDVQLGFIYKTTGICPSCHDVSRTLWLWISCRTKILSIWYYVFINFDEFLSFVYLWHYNHIDNDKTQWNANPTLPNWRALAIMSSSMSLLEY